MYICICICAYVIVFILYTVCVYVHDIFLKNELDTVTVGKCAAQELCTFLEQTWQAGMTRAFHAVQDDFYIGKPHGFPKISWFIHGDIINHDESV